MREIIEQYGEYIYHLSYLYVKNKESAEEITQDVFFTYARKQAQFKGESSLKTYLTKIAINRSYDELRKQKRKAFLDKIILFSKNVQSPEQNILQQQDAHSLKNQVMKLPIKYREMIILYYYEEYTAQEIAKLLQISENTVRTRLRRAKEQLKEQLGEWMEEGLYE